MPIELSLDVFANITYLEKHMLFLQEEKIDGKFKQSLRIIKLDFDQFFV